MLERWTPSFSFVTALTQLGQRFTRCQHSIPLLWHVEGNVRLARRRYGPLQYQLRSLRCSKILVRGPTGEGECIRADLQKFVFWLLLICVCP